MFDVQFPLKVMEPIRVEKIPYGDYLYQVKWDGMRWVTYKSQQSIYFQTKRQKVFSARFPELDSGFDWVPPESILDGEVVVLRGGKPHFPSLLRRIHSSPKKHFQDVPQELFVEYIIFDILAWEGQDWRQKPLYERLELLKANIPLTEHCQGIETFLDGAQLWRGIEQLSLEGIVAKASESTYRGGKDPAWLKVKQWQEQEFLVGGIKFKGNVLQAVCLGMQLESQFVYISSVSNGAMRLLNNKTLQLLRERSSSPFTGLGPTPGRGESIRWVEPTVALKTRFLEWTDEGKLRHAQIIE